MISQDLGRRLVFALRTFTEDRLAGADVCWACATAAPEHKDECPVQLGETLLKEADLAIGNHLQEQMQMVADEFSHLAKTVEGRIELDERTRAYARGMLVTILGLFDRQCPPKESAPVQ